MFACIICFSAAIPMCFLLRLYYVRENKRRDRQMEARGETYDEAAGDFADRTDVENVDFRYAL
jgi:hypothetical protein